MSELFTKRNTVKSMNFVENWVNSPQAGNIAEVAKKPSVHLSASIAQANQVTAIRASSAQTLNSHSSDLKTHKKDEANIKLTFKRPEENGTRNLVFTNASHATNINQEQQHPQYTPPSPSIIFGMQAQLNDSNTTRQLSRITMHFDGF